MLLEVQVHMHTACWMPAFRASPHKGNPGGRSRWQKQTKTVCRLASPKSHGLAIAKVAKPQCACNGMHILL